MMTFDVGKFGSLYMLHTKEISFRTSTDIRLTKDHDKYFIEIFQPLGDLFWTCSSRLGLLMQKKMLKKTSWQNQVMLSEEGASGDCCLVWGRGRPAWLTEPPLQWPFSLLEKATKSHHQPNLVRLGQTFSLGPNVGGLISKGIKKKTLLTAGSVTGDNPEISMQSRL